MRKLRRVCLLLYGLWLLLDISAYKVFSVDQSGVAGGGCVVRGAMEIISTIAATP